VRTRWATLQIDSFRSDIAYMRRILTYNLITLLMFALVSCSSGIQPTINEEDSMQPTLTPSPAQSIKKTNDFHPVLLQNHFVFGANNKNAWLGEEETAHIITGSEVFKSYSLVKYLGTSTNAKVEVLEDGIAVQVDSDYSPIIPNYEDQSFDSYYLQEVAIAGEWDALPRTPHVQVGGIETYESLIREMISQQGLSKEKVSIEKVIRVDLEGDGAEEALITATDWDVRKAVEQGEEGTYSVVILRKLVNGYVKNIVMKEQYTKDLANENKYIYYTPMVLDIDGDGVMEIFVEGRCKAWSLIEVYKVKDDNIEKVYAYEYGA